MLIKPVKFALIFILVAIIFLTWTRYKVALKYEIAFLNLQKAFFNDYDISKYKTLPLAKLDALNFIDEKALSLGKEEMKKHKVVFTGIARDNAYELPFVMRHIEHIGQFFIDYRVIIFENDSSDGTKDILNAWQDLNPKIRIISQNFANRKRPSIKFLADARNKYLEALIAKEYDEFDIVIPLDMDMKYGVDIRGIQHSFSKFDQWDVVCSNGVYGIDARMYDAFAFRNQEFPYSPKEYRLKTGKDYWGEYVRTIGKVYSPEADLIPVYSCFGGLAIYKSKMFSDCFYDSKDNDCEHVYLHQCMRSKNNAKIFMNPTQVILYNHCCSDLFSMLPHIFHKINK